MRQLVLAALAACSSLPAVAADFNPPLERMISNYIRPATAEFAEAAAALPASVTAVCTDTNAQAADSFKAAYAQTLRGFARVHFLRFGPLLDDDRLNRLAFLPDPRGIAQRQIRKIYAEKQPDALSADSLKGKSVAVQGLTALQLIAFDKEGSVVLGQPDADRDYTCGYAQAISENVASIAASLAAAWADPDGYSAVLVSAGPDSEAFRSSREAMETVFNVLVTGLIIVRDQDLLPALGTSAENARPHRFPFSRSGNGVLYLSSELGGIRDALLSFDLERITPEDFRWIAGTLRFEFDNAQTYLDRLEPPLRQTFDEEGSYDQAAVLAITVKSIRDTVALELAGALGLAGGFNSLDGD